MGGLSSRFKKNKGQQMEEKQSAQSTHQKKEQKNQVPIVERQLPIRQRRYIPRKRGPLTFKKVGQNEKELVNPKNPLFQSLESDRWAIDPEVIEHYRIKNTFQLVQQSPALYLQLTLVNQAKYLIGNADRLQAQREKVKNQDEDMNKSPAIEYAIIYADLFSIKFQFLKKIQLRGPNKKSEGAILSLEPIALIHCPLLEELTANDHPITNIRFLRRCIWPFLSILSLKNNSIADCNEIARVLPTITNIQHIEGIDIPGQFSKDWGEVSWICKMGFKDAEIEYAKLQSDQQYYHRFNNKVLRRVDCSLNDKKFVRRHIQVIRNKFNNPYFDNPISLCMDPNQYAFAFDNHFNKTLTLKQSERILKQKVLDKCLKYSSETFSQQQKICLEEEMKFLKTFEQKKKLFQ